MAATPAPDAAGVEMLAVSGAEIFESHVPSPKNPPLPALTRESHVASPKNPPLPALTRSARLSAADAEVAAAEVDAEIVEERAEVWEEEWEGYQVDIAAASSSLSEAERRRDAALDRRRAIAAQQKDDPRVFVVHDRTVKYTPRSMCCLLSPGRLARDMDACDVRRRHLCPACGECKYVLAPLRIGVWLRQVAVWLVEWNVFNSAVLTLIVLNSICMALTDFSVVNIETFEPASVGKSTAAPYGDATSALNAMNEWADPIFLACFVLELVVKVIAKGVWLDSHAYLRSGWNWIDGIVVFAGLLSLVPDIPQELKLTVLRTLRILRPLRSINSLPALRNQVRALLGAIPELIDVLVVMLFLFAVFGIVGLQLFMGAGHFRCRHTALPVALPTALWAQYNAEAAALAAEGSAGTPGNLLAAVVANRTLYPFCGEASFGTTGSSSSGGRAPTSVFDGAWTRSSSPWHHATSCVWPIVASDSRLCNDGSDFSFAWGQKVYTCPTGTHCGSNYDWLGNARFSDTDFMKSATHSEELQWGITGFDNIGQGFLTTFQCITLEGWINIVYQLMDVVGWTVVPVLFVLLIFFGSFFLLNLTLAVLGNSFDDMKTKAREVADVDEKAREELRKSEVAGSAALLAKTRELFRALDERGKGTIGKAELDECVAGKHAFVISKIEARQLADLVEKRKLKTLRMEEFVALVSSLAAERVHAEKQRNAQWHWMRCVHVISEVEGRVCTWWVAPALRPWVECGGRCAPPRERKEWTAAHWFLAPLRGLFYIVVDSALLQRENTAALASHRRRGGGGDSSDNSGDDDDESIGSNRSGSGPGEADGADGTACAEEGVTMAAGSARAPHSVALVIANHAFEYTITLCVFLNTAVLALDHYPREDAWYGETLYFGGTYAEQVFALEVVNYVFTAVFVLELVLKLLGLGCRAYLHEAMNVFDAFIVIVSIVELVVAPPAFLLDAGVRGLTAEETSTGGATSALRAVRVLRLFKLARNWHDLQVLLTTMAKSMRSAATFMVLMLLFVFIYTLVGMQFFANRLHFDAVTGDHVTLAAVVARFEANNGSALGLDIAEPRSNFNTVLLAVLTIVQIFTGEDWNAVMYDTMRSGQTAAASLYFISIICLGSFVMLDFFLAILLSDFNDAAQEEDAYQREIRKQIEETRCGKAWAWIISESLGALDFMDNGCRKRKGSATPDAGLEDGAGVVTHTPVPGASPDGGLTVNTAASVRDLTVDDAAELRDDDVALLEDSVEFGTSGRSCCIFSRQSWLRQKVYTFVTASVGDRCKPEPGQLVVCVINVEDMSGRSSYRDTTGTIVRIHVEGTYDVVFGEGESTWTERHIAPDFVKLTCAQSMGRKLESLHFDNFIMVVIVISSLLLAVDNPLFSSAVEGEVHPFTTFLFVAEIVVNVIFTLEASLKMLAFGVVLGKRAYLRDLWNFADFILVWISWGSVLLVAYPGLASLKTLRMLRVLRVLRTINKFPGLKLVVNALLSSVRPVANVIPVMMLFYFIFGVVATSSLKGALSACAGDAYEALSDAQRALIDAPLAHAALSASQQAWVNASMTVPYDGATSRAVCTWLGAEWSKVVPQSFDDSLLALSSLFQLSTTEGWVAVAFAATDSRGIDMQPVEGTNQFWLVFFMIFEAVGAYFFLSLIIGELIQQFNKEAKNGIQMQRGVLMTAEQQMWSRQRNDAKAQMRPLQNLQRLRPKPESHTTKCGVCWARFRLFLFNVTEPSISEWTVTKWQLGFEHFIMACIVANAIVMAMQYYGQSDEYSVFIAVCNYIFAVIFFVEAAMKLIAMGPGCGGKSCPGGYFMFPWNVFDFSIVIGSIVGVLASLFSAGSIGSIATLIRTFRIGRIFRLIKSAQSLRIIFGTLIQSLPALFNVGALLGLSFFIFTAIGVQLFAKVGWVEGGSMDEHANFASFPTALLTLLRMATGEAWPDMMYDLKDGPEVCDAVPIVTRESCGFEDPFSFSNDPFGEACVPINGCGTGFVAYFYWFSFQILINFVMLNLIVFYVLDSFARVHDGEARKMLTGDEQEIVRREFAKLDVNFDCVLESDALAPFFMNLPRPMGFKGSVTSLVEAQRRVQALHIPSTIVDRPVSGVDAMAKEREVEDKMNDDAAEADDDVDEDATDTDAAGATSGNALLSHAKSVFPLSVPLTGILSARRHEMVKRQVFSLEDIMVALDYKAFYAHQQRVEREKEALIDAGRKELRRRSTIAGHQLSAPRPRP